VDAPPPPPATPYSLLRAIDSEDEIRALLSLVKQGEHAAYAPQGDGEVFRCVFVGVVRSHIHPGSPQTGICDDRAPRPLRPVLQQHTPATNRAMRLTYRAMHLMSACALSCV
jgi:hypothetical protein